MPGPQGGTSVIPAGGSAGSPAAGGGGASGATAGGTGTGTGGACTASPECPMGQLCLMNKCGCAAYAPDYCEADKKCTAPMKDPDHCGGCTTKCGATQACVAGACAPEPMSIGEIAGCGTLKLQLAAGKIYALSTMTGDLASMAAPAGGAATPITTGIAMGSAFAVDATNAYVAAGMSITKVALAGGTKTVVVTETTPILDVAVGGTKLYYTVGKDIKVIDAAAVNGTPAATAVAMAIDEGEPQAVAYSAGYILYGSASAFNVESCKEGMPCHETELAPGAGHTKIGASQGGLIFGHRAVQADATNVYWVNNGMQAAPFTTAEHAAKGIPTKDGGAITAFAVAGGKIYYADADQNLQKGAPGDEEPVWIARGLGMVSSIVADDANVYLASGCKILKSPL